MKEMYKMFRDSIIHDLLSHIKLNYYRRKWRKLNDNNDTHLESLTNLNQIEVGKSSYGDLWVLSYSNEYKVRIGMYVSIGPNVTFLLNSDHPLTHISTFPFLVKYLGCSSYESISKGDIIVDDDVWIGFRSTIMSGVHIGQGAVVAAGAVVTKDVPPYAIVGGVPAKVIKYRFSPEVIEQLLKLDYSKLTDNMIRERIDDLYTSLDGKSPEEVEKLLAWFPKKQ